MDARPLAHSQHHQHHHHHHGDHARDAIDDPLLEPEESHVTKTNIDRVNAFVHLLDVRQEVAAAIKGSIIGVLAAQLLQSVSDFFLPQDSGYKVLVWIAVLAVTLTIFRFFTTFSAFVLRRERGKLHRLEAIQRQRDYDPNKVEAASAAAAAAAAQRR